MKIDSKLEIAGFSVKIIRKLFKNYDSLSVEILCDKLNVDQETSDKLLKEFVKLNYLDESKKKVIDSSIYYPLTIEGCALSSAKLLPPISRERADQFFENFLKRVQEVNENDNFLYEIPKVILFGSYLKGAEYVNDIDLAYHKIEKKKYLENWKEHYDQKCRTNRYKGDFNKYYSFPIDEIEKYLKSGYTGSQYISLVSTIDPIIQLTDIKEINLLK